MHILDSATHDASQGLHGCSGTSATNLKRHIPVYKSKELTLIFKGKL